MAASRSISLLWLILSFCVWLGATEETIRSHKVTAITSLAQLDGIVYNGKDGSLYFTDEQHDRIMRVRDPMKGSAPEIWRQPSGGATGMAVDLEGRLIVCESSAKRVTRTEHDGRVTVLADRYTYNTKGQALRFNNPKDVVVDSKGRIYFIDSSSDAGGESLRQQDAVYRIEPDVEGRKGEHRVRRILGNLRRADGLAVSADEAMLYVLDTHPLSNQLVAFMLMREGTPSFDRAIVLHDFGMSRGGDGICLDSRGRIYVAAGRNIPGTAPLTFEDKMYDQLEAGIYVFSRSGAALGSVAIPEDLVTDCAFGGPDMQTLFVTAGDSIYKVHVSWEESSSDENGGATGGEKGAEVQAKSGGQDDKDTYYKAPLPDAGIRPSPNHWLYLQNQQTQQGRSYPISGGQQHQHQQLKGHSVHTMADGDNESDLEDDSITETREKIKQANMSYDKEQQLKQREEEIRKKEEELKNFEQDKKELERQQRVLERALKLKQVEAGRENIKKQTLAANTVNLTQVKEEKLQKERMERKLIEERERKEKARLQVIEKKKERERQLQEELERQKEEQLKQEELLKLKAKKQHRQEKAKLTRTGAAALKKVATHEEL